MRQPPGHRQPGRRSAKLRPKCAREEMQFDVPGTFALWAGRAHTILESQIRRRKAKLQQQRAEQQQPAPQQTSSPAKPAKPQKRDWWRLDPNASDKYRPIEPPAIPDPDLVPTPDRIVFGWEAPLSPLEMVLQDDVRRLFPKFHHWIVSRAIERAGLASSNTNWQPAEPPDHDIDPDALPPHGSNTEENEGGKRP